MPRRSSARFRLGTALLVLCAALACKPDKPVTPGADGDGKGAVGPDGKPIAIAPIGKAIEMLPGNTAIYWEMAGPDRIAEVVGRDALVQKFEPQYRKFATELQLATGHDLLDPRQLAEMGIDTKGRIGFALVSLEPMTLVGFITLSDKGRFRQSVFDIAKKTGTDLVPTPLGHAEILRQGPFAIVVREPFAAFVVTSGRDDRQDLAFEIATMDPARSLASAKNFRKATGALSPSDAIAYFDGVALTSAVVGQMQQRSAPTPASNWARDELAKARQDNAPPERIKELEAQAEQVDKENARWEKRRQGEREMFEKLFGGIQTSVWTADAKPGGMVAQGTTTFAPDSPVLLAFDNGTGSPPLARALDGRPLLMLSAKANVEQLAALFDLFAKGDGTTWADVSAEIAKETGIDPDKDLKPLVTGLVGFAITHDGGKSTGDLEKQIGFALHVEVHDPKGAGEVLAKAAKAVNAQKDGPKARKSGDGWIIDVPKWRKVHAGVQGPHLVISTDPKLVGRIASGAAGSVTKSGDSAALAAAAIQGSAASVLTDPALGLWLFMGRMRMSSSIAMAESPEDAKVPKSRTWKAKERELKALETKMEKAEDARARAELESFRAVVEPWGPFAGHVKREGNALVFQGGWFVRADGIAGALAQSLAAVKTLEDRKPSDELSSLFERQAKLQNELMEIRRADIETFRARKAR